MADFQADVAHYVLPLDSFLPDLGEDEFARNLIVQQCMQIGSVRWPIAGLLSRSNPPTTSANGRTILYASTEARDLVENLQNAASVSGAAATSQGRTRRQSTRKLC